MDASGQEAILGLAGEQLARAMDRSHSALFKFKGTPSEFVVLQEQAVQAGFIGPMWWACAALSQHRMIRPAFIID